MRRSIVRKTEDGLHLQRAQLRYIKMALDFLKIFESFLSCHKFSIHQMRKLLGIMYPSELKVFDSINEMIEMLIVAAYYDITWIVEELENCLRKVIHPQDPRKGGPRQDLSRDEKLLQARVVKIFAMKKIVIQNNFIVL